MPRGPLPLVDAPAAEIAVRLVRKIERVRGRFPLSLSKANREAFRAGKLPIKRDSALAAGVVAVAIEELALKRASPRVERLRAQLRAAFGERAFRKGTQHAEWRIDFQRRQEEAAELRGDGRPATGGRQPLPMLPQGLHVAPFLSPDGNVVLVLIGDGGGLAFSSEFAPVGPSLSNGAAEGEEFKATDAIHMVDGTAAMMSLLRCGRIKDADASYGPGSLPPGVHRAPWRPWAYPDGFCVVAIGPDRRLVASMNAGNAQAAAHARRELAILLEAFAPAPAYKDPYDDGFEDPNDCGEDWKK